MKSTDQIISELNITDETANIEVKSIQGGELGKSFYETVSAFSNEPGLGGGTILLGVEREDALFPIYDVVGVSQPDKLSTDIATGCQTIFNVSVRPTIKQSIVEGVCVARVDIKEAPVHDKPVYVKSRGISHGSYRRIVSADVKCTDDDLYALFSHRSEEPFNTRTVSESTWADLDEQAIDAYRSARSKAHSTAEELGWDNKDLVFALRGCRNIDGSLLPTYSGILLFGSGQALRRLTPTHRVDYIRVPGRTWVEDPDTRFESLELRGPLISLIPRVIAAVLDDLPRAFSFPDGDAHRSETPAVPRP